MTIGYFNPDICPFWIIILFSGLSACLCLNSWLFWLFWVMGSWRKHGPLFCLTGTVCAELDCISHRLPIWGAWWIHLPESTPSKPVPGDWGLLQNSNSDKSTGQWEIVRLPSASAGRDWDTRPIHHLPIEVLGVMLMSKLTCWDPVATSFYTDG